MDGLLRVCSCCNAWCLCVGLMPLFCLCLPALSGCAVLGAIARGFVRAALI